MSFLFNQYLSKNTTVSAPLWTEDTIYTCTLPCKNNKCGWKCVCTNTINTKRGWKCVCTPMISKSTQTVFKPTSTETETSTETSTEFVLGELILRHCPQPHIVRNYVNHINTSPMLVQLLTQDTQHGVLLHSERFHSDE